MEQPHISIFPDLYKNKAYLLNQPDYAVTIVLADSSTVYIDEADQELLSKILQAVNISLLKAKVINVKNFDAAFPPLLDFSSEKVISFGVDLSQFGHNVNPENYQVLAHNDKTFLIADELAAIAKDKQKKIQLWQALKQIFS